MTSPLQQKIKVTGPVVVTALWSSAADYERWLAGMRRIRESLRGGGFLKVKT
jgi:hypothetical protein